MSKKIILVIFLIQVLSALLMGMFTFLLPGILINGVFVLAYSIGSLIPIGFRRGVNFQYRAVSQRDFVFSYFVLFLCLVVFIDGALVMPSIGAIFHGEVAFVRGFLLESQIKYWQPRLIGYISVFQTIYAIYWGLMGYRGRTFFFQAIFISLLNTLLVFGRGYLMMNIFAIAYYMLLRRAPKYLLLGIVLMIFMLFVGMEYLRHPEDGLLSGVATFSEYLIMPLVGSTYNINMDVVISYFCQSSFFSIFTAGCVGDLSKQVVSIPNNYLQTNVYGAVGEWLASLDILVVPLLGIVFGVLATISESIYSPKLESLGIYLIGIFSFFCFFSDPFTANGFYFSLLLVWLFWMIASKVLRNAYYVPQSKVEK